MSHMKRTQIYHARGHNEENPLGSVAVTKHEEGSSKGPPSALEWTF